MSCIPNAGKKRRPLVSGEELFLADEHLKTRLVAKKPPKKQTKNLQL